MSQLYLIFTQFFPPKAPLTESNLPRQDGKVFIITGGSSGIGFELARILYYAGGTVYIMSHHERRALQAIETIKASPAAPPTAESSRLGVLKFIHLDLADLSTVPTAVASFQSAETRLDVLFNNAGIASAPLDMKTAQGLEPHFGTNCLGPFLLTKLLLPTLNSTAAMAPANSVRVIWTSSILVELGAPEGGMTITQLRDPSKNRNEHYSASKAGNWFLASEYQNRFGDKGVIHLTTNPGSLRTNTWRTTPKIYYWPFYPILSRPVDGAHTNLWVAFSKDITSSDGGRYAMPFGRWHPGQRHDVVLALKSKEEGGTGEALGLWDWCEEQAKPFIPG